MSSVKAVLGPTNTGKTHLAIERMCAHSSGIMAFPLRLLAREAYDRVVRIKGADSVGLVTGEERHVPSQARYLMCTAEATPTDDDFAFAAVDEVQIGTDPERGHVFTDRIIHLRGREETMLLGSQSVSRILRTLLPDVDMSTRPRFSKLSYAAPCKLSRLPPRTAIVAFSADEVYEIAEELRRARGGAAIVMGNLSPGTRNAQVAMYQAGEVDFIVATDAIGMGLNMDIDHVAFASLHKFDGRRNRRLRVDEMAQIAGRAGRHQRDGSFGTLLRGSQQDALLPEEIERIEDHRFHARDWLYWRSSDRDFRSPDDLAASLKAVPHQPELRLAPPADDLKVLEALIAIPAVADRSWSEPQTRRLWDACGLPDFRNVGPEHHSQLVARLFRYIGGASHRVPENVLQAEVARLDVGAGDIGQLASRLAGIRTWAYAANRRDWIDNPAHWIERTREVERRLSETLHQRLVERFVEKRALRRGGGQIEPSFQDVRFDAEGSVTVLDEPVGVIDGLSFRPSRVGATSSQRKLIAVAEKAWAAHLQNLAAGWADLPVSGFALETLAGIVPYIMCNGLRLATLERGKRLVAPSLRLVPPLDTLEPKLRERLIRNLECAIGAMVAQRLKPLLRMQNDAFDVAVSGNVRALLARLADDGGVCLRKTLDDAIRPLSGEERKALRHRGLVIGSLGIFHPGLLKPECVRLRLALLAAYRGLPMPQLPMPGLTLIDRPSTPLQAMIVEAGFVGLDNQYLRVDLAERIAEILHRQRVATPIFVPDRTLATSVGIGERTFAAMLRTLGFVPGNDTQRSTWRWRGLVSHRSRLPARRSAPDVRQA